MHFATNSASSDAPTMPAARLKSVCPQDGMTHVTFTPNGRISVCSAWLNLRSPAFAAV